MTERFYSVNGQMMGYESGGVKKDFLTDHLGSITAEIRPTDATTGLLGQDVALAG
jgi:hypothetical protein